MTASLDDELDQLFTRSPGEFVAARDDLAKQLKQEGRDADAATVKALRRPTVAAWAVNEVARRAPGDVQELLDAGAALRTAQRRIVSGGSSDALRDASARRRKAVAALTKQASRLLAGEGHSSAGALEAVTATFEAASIDDEAAEAVRAGRLSKELPAPLGFGEVTGLEVVPGGRGRTEAAQPSAAAEARDAAARAKRLGAEASQARRRAIKARELADRAQAKLERLQSDVEQARDDARTAVRDAREAEVEADRAQARADRAAR
jgi:hypothetical protein